MTNGLGENGGVALVTGCGAGIGAAIAQRLAASGLTVLACDFEGISSHDLGQADSQGNIVFHAIDLSSRESVEKAVFAATQLGPLRALVNYTGSMRVALIETVDDAYLKTSLDLDLGGIVRTCSCAVPYFAAHASVVNVGGVVATAGGAPGLSIYAAANGGIEGLTRALAAELGPRGVRVNAVAAGFVQAADGIVGGSAGEKRLAERIPLRRLGALAEVAEAVDFLVSPRSSYITGTVLRVDGGVGVT
jgi:NAD(P)-dependent dehydrogenase (short-subunit alcohol dehydrogenase family)